jgi:hypothetical protein
MPLPVMLNEVKHLACEWGMRCNYGDLSCDGQILRLRLRMTKRKLPGTRRNPDQTSSGTAQGSR